MTEVDAGRHQTLSARMRELADSGHAMAEELRASARELDEKTAGFFGEPQTVPVGQFVGAWARAKLLWRAATGEFLI